MRVTAIEYNRYYRVQRCSCGRYPAVIKNGTYRVTCICGRRTADYFTREMAVAMWNKEARN